MAQKKVGEIKELQDKLNSNNNELKLEAVRRIIDAMTRGKDVSVLFMDIIKNMETNSIQLKKLIYLYIINYAKTRANEAILGINSFRKDARDKANPFLRALAVRTMGCIRIKQVAEYLCDPLKNTLKDDDSYVRKTAVMCVPKLYQIAPELIEEQGFLKVLENMLSDGNAMVVSNTVAALMICGQSKGQPLLKLNSYIVQKLLTAMNDCNQWGIIYILDALSTYVPADASEAQSIMQRISSRLAHTNSAVALTSIRLIMKYMDYLTNPETTRNYAAKISAPLITLLSRQPQIAYLTLKTINLILQKRPMVIPKEIKIFFVKYHDPSYIKLQKLEILAKVANNDNINQILHELKQYSQEVDVEFVRKSVRIMGRCAIKLQKMADKCVQVLWEALKTKVNYVVQEAIIVIRDIFRKYPNKYQALLKDICDNLKSLDDPEAKASIVWIIGEYVEMIENADELLQNFAEGFKDQPDVVQQQILISCVKLFLTRPADGQEIVKDLLKMITTECQNPDLRDRGFIYWRLIATSPQLAKKVVFSERPLISEQSYTIDSELLDKLVQNIGTLSAVYYKEPASFVKKIKDSINAKEVIEEDGEMLIDPKAPEEKVQFFADTPQVTTFAKPSQPLPTNTVDLLDTSEPTPVVAPVQPQPTRQAAQIDLLSMAEPTVPSASIYQTQVPPVNVMQGNIYSTQVQQQASSIDILGDLQPPQPQQQVAMQPPGGNIVVPLVVSLKQTTQSHKQLAAGLLVKAAFQRLNGKMFLDLHFQNKSSVVYNDFAMKFNRNAFKLNPQNFAINIGELNPGQIKTTRISIVTTNQTADIEGFPFVIETALKSNLDMFIFEIPCSLSVVMVQGFNLTIEKYKQLISNPNNKKKQETLPNKLDLESFVEKLAANNVNLVFRRQNGNCQYMSYGIMLVNGIVCLVDVIFDKTCNSANIQITSVYEKIIPLVNNALAMIINL